MEKWINEFRDKLVEIGLKEGDMVYVSSDFTMIIFDAMKQFGMRKKELNNFIGEIIDCIQYILGAAGTILIPMFTWRFCNTKFMDMRDANGEVGAFGNWVLENRKEFSRTKHPIYSFMVWGKYAETLLAMDNYDAWGADSPFSLMHHNDAKNLLIDTTLERAFTFTHYVENCIKVPYRYMKEFSGEYIDADGHKFEKSCAMYVRKLDIKSKQITPDNCLVEAGVAKKVKFGSHDMQLVDLANAFSIVKDNILYHNADQWYEFSDYVIDWDSSNS